MSKGHCFAPFCIYKIGQLLICDFINLHKILCKPKQNSERKQNSNYLN